MYGFLIGKVEYIKADKIYLNVNNVGYSIIMGNPYEYKVGEETKIYTYLHVREDILILYGFKSIEEHDLFLSLISVKGIGPKGGLAIVSAGNIEGVINAIELGDSTYLKKFPGVGPKASQQIILDLSGKLVKNTTSKGSTELIEALSSLGYSSKEIKRVSKNIDPLTDISIQIKEALKLMLK